jgi:F420-dependent oxidoreductase-like protein
MRLCLMVEGQEDVTWEGWRALAGACEQSGIETLFRSDHYLSVEGAHTRGSLDAWTTLAALAAVTTTLRLGTLVSPATFRHPAVLAKSVTTVDRISAGRAELGMGAGWLAAEHAAFGFPFPPLRERMERLEEQLEIVRRLWADGGASYAGRHFGFGPVDAQPKPVQRPGPRLLLGGDAGPRSVRLAARFADEYNSHNATPDECGARRARVAEACEREGREPLPFSLMTGFLVGADRRELLERARRLAAWRRLDSEPDELLGSLPASWVVGTVPEALEQLRELSEAGVARVMLQHHLHASTRASRTRAAPSTTASARRSARKVVLPVGSHGIEAGLLARVHGTLAETRSPSGRRPRIASSRSRATCARTSRRATPTCPTSRR